MEKLFSQETSSELDEQLDLLGQLCRKARDLIKLESIADVHADMDYRDTYGDLQKAVVGMIRGSEIAFQQLTGVKYHD